MILGAPKLKEIANGRPLVCKGAARRGKRDGVAPATFSGHENINANIDVYQYFALLIHMSICFFWLLKFFLFSARCFAWQAQRFCLSTTWLKYVTCLTLVAG
jgi:hypothetical protein